MITLVRPALFMACCLANIASGQTLTSVQTLGLSPVSSGILLAIPVSLSLPSIGTFLSFNGSLFITTEVRTVGTGTGQVLAQVTSDFSPITGPTASAGKVFYSCVASYGTPCSGQVQASVTSQTQVVSYAAQSCTGGGGSCSGSDPNTITLSLSVLDSPTYKTGAYTASLTFTISTI